MNSSVRINSHKRKKRKQACLLINTTNNYYIILNTRRQRNAADITCNLRTNYIKHYYTPHSCYIVLSKEHYKISDITANEWNEIVYLEIQLQYEISVTLL